MRRFYQNRCHSVNFVLFLRFWRFKLFKVFDNTAAFTRWALVRKLKPGRQVLLRLISLFGQSWLGLDKLRHKMSTLWFAGSKAANLRFGPFSQQVRWSVYLLTRLGVSHSLFLVCGEPWVRGRLPDLHLLEALVRGWQSFLNHLVRVKVVLLDGFEGRSCDEAHFRLGFRLRVCLHKCSNRLASLGLNWRHRRQVELNLWVYAFLILLLNCEQISSESLNWPSQVQLVSTSSQVRIGLLSFSAYNLIQLAYFICNWRLFSSSLVWSETLTQLGSSDSLDLEWD
jgi:hypothetical protein